MDWQDAIVAVIVILAGLVLWRRLRPRKRRTVAFVPLDQVRPRPRPEAPRGPGSRSG